MNYADEQSNIRTITESITQTSAGSDSSGGCDDSYVQVYESPDSLLSDTQRKVIDAIGGSRGETLRRTLARNAQALQRERADANRTSAAMRLDVQEYISLLEGRFAAEFREIGNELGGLIERGKRHDSGVRQIKG